MTALSAWVFFAFTMLAPPNIGSTTMQAQTASVDTHPITMNVRTIDRIEWLIVEGDTSVPVELEYELVVASRSGRGGSNRARQRGVVRLQAGQPTIMVRLRVTREWDAELIVRTLDQHEIYRETLSSDA